MTFLDYLLTGPPLLVNLVCEQPPIQIKKIYISYVFWICQLGQYKNPRKSLTLCRRFKNWIWNMYLLIIFFLSINVQSKGVVVEENCSINELRSKIGRWMKIAKGKRLLAVAAIKKSTTLISASWLACLNLRWGWRKLLLRLRYRMKLESVKVS